MKINKEQLKDYLEKKFGSDIKINEFKELGKGVYGTAYLIDFNAGDENKRLVLKTMNRGGFGHDFKADIAQNLILAHDTFNKLPKHIKSYDVVAAGEEISSVGIAEDYYILLEEAIGTQYNDDLDRIGKEGLKEEDKEKARKLAEYLAELHKEKHPDQALCTRRARDLVGHGEYIMGVLDGYPRGEFLNAGERADIVKRCVDWWQKLQDYSERFCVVHGDYHPFNILFKEDGDFLLLDRSRGEFGEPAEDIASLAINYLFWALVKYGKLENEFKELWDIFFSTYLEKTKDKELLKVIQPFFAFRALVVANPVFYPDDWLRERGADPADFRGKLMNFVKNVLAEDEIDIKKINRYLE